MSPRADSATTAGHSHASTAGHAHTPATGPTQLCDCHDRLACKPEPSCEEFFQIVRLRGVANFENPAKPNKFTDAPVMIATARPEMLAARLGMAVRHLAAPAANVKAKSRRSSLPNPGSDLAAAVAAANQAIEDAVSAARGGLTGVGAGLPICRDVELSFVIRYRQCWTPAGYTRGDLLQSISLAPGEELTLEFFTWDRRRLERELNRESSQESSESASVTSRISSEVVNNLQFKVGMGADAKVGGSLSLAAMELPIDVNGEVGANFTTEMATSLTATTASLNEATMQAANTLRNSQKTRILEVSETGSESRSTRRIKNENRCHTINYDYFEILEHYDVRVDIAGVEFVARVPLPDMGRITLAWLLCHEFPLRRSLLDPLYEAGFDAAKFLRSVEIFRHLVTPPPVPPAARVEGRNPPDTLGDQLRVLLAAIKGAKDRLAGVSELSMEDWGDVANPFSGRHKSAYRRACKVVTRDYITDYMTGIFQRIEELHARRNDKGIDLFAQFDIFFSQLNSAAMMNLVTLALGGNPQLRLDAFKQLVFTYDDEGLIGAIDAAQKRIEALRPSVNAQGAAAVALPEPAAADQPESVDEKVAREFGLRNMADAQVEVDRLVCHLTDHLDHYLTVLYLYEGPTAWRQILEACPQVANLVEPRIIAIQDGYAYFPLRLTETARRNIAALDAAIASWRRDMAAATPARTTLSTKGTTLEARLGQCGACEPFIEAHREHDLALKAQEVLQSVQTTRLRTAEADRMAARLAQTPPLLEDPTPESPAVRVVLEQKPAAPAPTP